MRSNKSWLWALFCSILLFWSCAEPNPILDEEALLSADLTLLSDDLKVDDLLMEGAPEEFQAATATILQNGMGNRLLRFVSGYLHEGLIQFRSFSTIRPEAQMGYAGRGIIFYNTNALKHGCNDELLFHEFFHLYQNKNMPPVKNRANEIEAYIAQWLYSRNKGSSSYATLIDGVFTKIIMDLANYIDPSTGYFKSGIDRDEFNKLYMTALNYLEIYPDYYGDEWTSDWSPTEYPFPNLLKLLNENV